MQNLKIKMQNYANFLTLELLISIALSASKTCMVIFDPTRNFSLSLTALGIVISYFFEIFTIVTFYLCYRQYRVQTLPWQYTASSKPDKEYRACWP